MSILFPSFVATTADRQERQRPQSKGPTTIERISAKNGSRESLRNKPQQQQQLLGSGSPKTVHEELDAVNGCGLQMQSRQWAHLLTGTGDGGIYEAHLILSTVQTRNEDELKIYIEESVLLLPYAYIKEDLINEYFGLNQKSR
jgi:hypothetical protein